MGDWLQVSHPIAQLALAGDPDAAQDGSSHLREGGLDPVEPGSVGRVKDEFEAAELAGEEALGLTRAMSGVIVEQDADQHTHSVGCIELLQESEELTAAWRSLRRSAKCRTMADRSTL